MRLTTVQISERSASSTTSGCVIPDVTAVYIVGDLPMCVLLNIDQC